jgi:hypothetical protein
MTLSSAKKQAIEQLQKNGLHFIAEEAMIAWDKNEKYNFDDNIPRALRAYIQTVNTLINFQKNNT